MLLDEQDTHTERTLRGGELGEKPKFDGNNTFQLELKRRVDDYFQRTKLRQRDCPQMYLKTAILLTIFAGSYALLVFVAETWWQALPLAVLLGLATACIGFNIQHDGGHHAYSNYAWVNKLMAMSLDLMGGSSYHWHWKHGVFHHTHVNITGHDNDIELGFLGRVTPHQKRFSFHRWQHLYIWPFYGLLAIKWQLFDDFWDTIMGRIGKLRYPRPKGRQMAIFLGGKAVFFTLAFGIPLLCHPFWVVVLYYVVVKFVLGISLSVVFQLAHCVEEAEFPMPREGTQRMENSWAVHQVETTVNFARRSRLAAWLFGGLNYQIEHHLFPRICHINYPAMSKVVEETCREFGVRYAEHKTFWSGVAAHYRWLRRMGMSDTAG